MFIVSILGKKQLFLNSKTDDFLRLLPGQFDCDESDVVAECVDEADQKTIRREMKINTDCNHHFDLESKKLLRVKPAKFIAGNPNPNHILNKTPKGNDEIETSVGAIGHSEFKNLSEEEKITYLKFVHWIPRHWEQVEYQTIIGAGDANMILNADSPECKSEVTEVLTFKTKRVVKINYSQTVNSLTGEVGQKVESMEFEE
jgi:hypothetical protein